MKSRFDRYITHGEHYTQFSIFFNRDTKYGVTFFIQFTPKFTWGWLPF